MTALRKSLLPAAILLGLGVATILLVVYPLVATPRFIVTNLSGKAFVLTVEWRDQSMNLGHVEPHKRLEFRHNGEAAITFIAKFPSGVRVSSKPVFFTRGTVVYAQVSESNIKVAYEKST